MTTTTWIGRLLSVPSSCATPHHPSQQPHITPSYPKPSPTRLASIDQQTRTLEKRKRVLTAELAESEQVSHALHREALELAQHRDMESARLAADAKDFISKYSRMHRKQQQDMKEKKRRKQLAAQEDEEDPKAVVMTKEMRLAVKRSERKLDLKLYIDKLAKKMAGVKNEAEGWERRAAHAKEQRSRAENKLKAVPRRYRETVADVRMKLVAALEKRAELAESLSRAELGGVRRIEDLHEQLHAAGRETTAVSDGLAEARRDVEHWRQQCEVVEALCAPLRARVTALQGEFREVTPSALAPEDPECDDDDLLEAGATDGFGGGGLGDDDGGEINSLERRGERGLMLAILEGLSASEGPRPRVCGDNDGQRGEPTGYSDPAEPTSIPMRCVRQAVLEYLAPEHEPISTLSDERVLQAALECGFSYLLPGVGATATRAASDDARGAHRRRRGP